MQNLMKKDFLIVKKMSYIILGLSLIIPVFFNFIAEGVALPFVLVNTTMIMVPGNMFFHQFMKKKNFLNQNP